jgi:hypothetical protein
MISGSYPFVCYVQTVFGSCLGGVKMLGRGSASERCRPVDWTVHTYMTEIVKTDQKLPDSMILTTGARFQLIFQIVYNINGGIS